MGKAAVTDVRAFLRMWNDDIALIVRGEDWSSGVRKPVIGKIEFIEQAEGFRIEPAISLSHETAQELIDSLWNCGLRPSQGRQSEGVTAAQNAHLADMRAIAFDRLKIERPK